jgi:uncharacterized repeat protein (TIGR01451 family)
VDRPQTLSNTATVTSNANDPNPQDNTATIETTVDPASGGVANISLVKTGVPATVPRNGVLTYRLTVTNDGPDDATGVLITDRLPSGVTFVSASPDCTVQRRDVLCIIRSLANGEQVTETIIVTTNRTGTITNTATVISNDNDPNPDNNTDDEESGPTPTDFMADLSITKTGSPNPAMVGNNLTYTLTVANDGPAIATGVTVIDALPNVDFLSASPGCNPSGGTVTCDLGTVSSGQSRTVTITVRPQTSGVIVNSATVSGNESDPVASNNTATLSTTVEGTADMQLAKTSSAGTNPTLVGDELTYTLTVTNLGPDEATDVVVSDTLPGSVTFVRASSGCFLAGRTVTCEFGKVQDGATVMITVIPNDVGVIQNTARVTANEGDPNPDNNDATLATTVIRVEGFRGPFTATGTEDLTTSAGTCTWSTTWSGEALAAIEELPDGMTDGVVRFTGSKVNPPGTSSNPEELECLAGNFPVDLQIPLTVSGSLLTGSITSGDFDIAFQGTRASNVVNASVTFTLVTPGRSGMQSGTFTMQKVPVSIAAAALHTPPPDLSARRAVSRVALQDGQATATPSQP